MEQGAKRMTTVKNTKSKGKKSNPPSNTKIQINTYISELLSRLGIINVTYQKLLFILPNSFSWIVFGVVTSGVVALVVTAVVARISLMSRFWIANFEYQGK